MAITRVGTALPRIRENHVECVALWGISWQPEVAFGFRFRSAKYQRIAPSRADRPPPTTEISISRGTAVLAGNGIGHTSIRVKIANSPRTSKLMPMIRKTLMAKPES
jgi:hypothetical protein